jgi:hypothetical protein
MTRTQKDYYVYTHSLAGQPPFYVGKGNAKRIKRIPRENNPHHCNIIAKYGKENIIVRTMLCRSESHALDLEIKLIAALRAGGVKLVNVTNGGDGMSGHKHSEETRAKLSEAARNRSEETRAKISKANTGRKHTEETKAKMSEVHKNMSDETKVEISAKLSACKIGNVVSEETKAKISKANKGRPKSEGTKAKMSEAAKTMTDEHKAKMKIARNNRPPASEETKAKMSAAQKLRYSNNISTKYPTD